MLQQSKRGQSPKNFDLTGTRKTTQIVEKRIEHYNSQSYLQQLQTPAQTYSRTLQNFQTIPTKPSGCQSQR